MTKSKDKKKGSQLVIRVDRSERDAFVALCDRLDTSAAREIRRFMRDMVAAHPNEAPGLSGQPDSAATDRAPATRDKAALPDPDVATDRPEEASGKPKKTRAPKKKA
ncbi:MAG: hypothetical protein ACK4GT_16480 [Pararhodobacter sp.]